MRLPDDGQFLCDIGARGGIELHGHRRTCPEAGEATATASGPAPRRITGSFRRLPDEEAHVKGDPGEGDEQDDRNEYEFFHRRLKCPPASRSPALGSVGRVPVVRGSDQSRAGLTGQGLCRALPLISRQSPRLIRSAISEPLSMGLHPGLFRLSHLSHRYHR